jgi:hypothetical protein
METEKRIFLQMRRDTPPVVTFLSSLLRGSG